MGATFGGNTSPASSECVITMAPSKRVETPQEVAHTNPRPPYLKEAQIEVYKKKSSN